MKIGWNSAENDESQHLLEGGQQTIQGNDSEAGSSRGWLHWAYAGVFGRKGWLSGAPVFPGPHLSKEWQNTKTEWTYFGFRDAIQRTLGFFAAQSISSSIFYAINETFFAPPGQMFDIRFKLAQQAHRNFSFYLQCESLSVKMPSTIFWLITVPSFLRGALFLLHYCMTDDQKARTAEAFNDANSWRECLTLYGSQALEVFLANVLVDYMAKSMGTTEEAVLNDPVLINGLKVALALGFDFVRNGVANVLETESVKQALENAKRSIQEKGGCCLPKSRVTPLQL